MKNFHAGTNINQGYYKSFQPELINRPWQLDDMKMVQLLTEANRQIGKLDMYSEYIPNIELFISMHVIKEATQSSKIEGTQTRIEEALLNKEDIAPNKRDDWQEVQNYIKAMNYAIDRMKTLPLSTRLIRETHQILLDGVRGKNKLPGEFRKSQNWIGGANINDAVFIPPVHNSVDDLMSDIEKFLHNEESYFPDLLKIALIHYQFETIHPFLDGNGRIGRLLITLYLVDKQILKSPILYLSDFFERNRVLYYDNLMRVRTHNDIKQWCYFFLSGIIEISKNGINTFDNILKLKQKLEIIFGKMGSKAPYGRKLVNYLYKNPLVAASKVTEITGLSKSSAYKLVNDLEDLKILREITGSKRGKIYLFAEYLGFFQS